MNRILLSLALVSIHLLGFSQTDNPKKFKAILTIPFFNDYRHQAMDTTWKHSGFYGFAAGLDYGTEKNRWNFTCGASTDILAPIGPIDVEGTYTSADAVFLNLSRKTLVFERPKESSKHAIEIFYGLNLTRYFWTLRNTALENEVVSSSANTSLGLNLGVNYVFQKYFYTGIRCQPSFLILEEANHYQHVLSVDIGFRLGK